MNKHYFEVKTGDLVEHNETERVFYVVDVRRTSTEFGGDWVWLLDLESGEYAPDRLSLYDRLVKAEQVAKVVGFSIYKQYPQLKNTDEEAT